MEFIRRPARWMLVLAVLSLLAAACGGGNEEPPEEQPPAGGTDTSTEAPTTAAGGDVSVYICEPENLSPPSNVTESCGAEVLNALYSPLVEIDTENAQALMGDDAPTAVAESITTEDNQTFTITLKDGWTMHDGTPLTAQNYVDAWNYGAYGPNVTTGGYFFLYIEGADKMQCAELNEEGTACVGEEPTVTEMSGLKVVDDLTFTVKTTQPFSIFPLLLNYTAFYPVPEDFLTNADKYTEAPVGNGPFKMDGTWQHDREIRTTRFDEWGGEAEGNVRNAVFQIYAEVDTGFNDLRAGNLDIMDEVPPEQFGAAEAEFGERFIRQPSAIVQYIGFPNFDPKWEDVNLRRAFSMALDRQAIADAVRQQSSPIDGFVPTATPGALGGFCGGYCEYNLEEAKRLYEEAGGYEGTVELWFNNDGNHEEWMQAVANQWRQNLGVQDVKFRSLPFSEILGIFDAHKQTGPYRFGWIPDYPSPHTYLDALFGTQGSSNDSGYSNKEFDELVAQGAAADSPEESVEFFQQAEEILNEDLPAIPMFADDITGAYTERVEGLEIDYFENINLEEITVTD